MTTAHVAIEACCGADPATAVHHDRLLTVDVDAAELLALLELAVTWHELDYSAAGVVGPAGWARFAEQHRWRHPEVAERAFSLALDVVGRSRLAPARPAVLAELLELVRS